MARLFGILYSIGGTSLSGSAMAIALTLGQDRLQPIVISAGAGALVAIPICWVVARRLAGT